MCVFQYIGSMSNVTTSLDQTKWRAIDNRLRRVDEDRWISSRFAAADSRKPLVALYGLSYELARVRLVVSEEGLGAIRFQWWRDALEKIETGKPSGEHDVCLALAEVVDSNVLHISALQKLVDGYQSAYEARDRGLEPEGWLAAIAASVLAPAHGWGEQMRKVAPFYAAVRRAESQEFGPHVEAAPKDIRPAIAHFRLRKLYVDGKSPNPLTKRFSIMKAINTGRV